MPQSAFLCLTKKVKNVTCYYCSDVGTFVPEYVDSPPTLFAVPEEAHMYAEYLRAHNMPCEVASYPV